MPDTLPQTFGRFQVIKKLGEGGMGDVYLAEDTVLKRRVALKVPKFRAGDNGLVVQRFLREARLASQLDHPNLCPVHDVGCIDGVHYLALAYIEGTPLDHCLAPDQPLPTPHAIGLVRHLIRVLALLHDKGIIHRDLKPANVMIRADGSPVLMDFGLARTFDASSQQLTTQGKALGTPAFMAPEQVNGDEHLIGPHTDVWALGVMLYQMLTGQLPFVGATQLEVWSRILYKKLTPPSALVAGLEPRLDAILAQVLAKDPQQRPASMAAFDHLLATGEGQAAPARLEPNMPPSTQPAHPVATPSPPPAPPRTRRMLLLAGAMVLGVGAVIAGLLVGLDAFTPVEPTTKPNQATPLSRQASLRLLPLEEVTLQAGEERELAVRIERREWDGEVTLAPLDLSRDLQVVVPPLARGETTGQLKVRALKDAVAGRYSIRLRAQGGDHLRDDQALLVVVRTGQPALVAGLRLLLPNEVTVTAGKKLTLEVEIERVNCDGEVRLFQEGQAEGVSLRLPPIPSGDCKVKIQVQASALAKPGKQQLQILARGPDRVEAEGTFSIQVKPAPPPTATALKLILPNEVSVTAGANETIEVEIERTNCDGEVRLFQEGQMEGVQLRLLPIPDGESKVKIQVQATEGAKVGVRQIRLLARGPNKIETEEAFAIRIKPAAPPTVTALKLILPDEVSVTAGGKQAVEIEIERTNCTGAVRLYQEGQAEGIQLGLAPIQAGKSKVTIQVQASAAATGGKQRVGILARGPDKVEAEGAFTVQIKPAPTKSSAALKLILPDEVSVTAGETKTVVVKIERTDFTDEVTLLRESEPEGIELRVSPIAEGKSEVSIQVRTATTIKEGKYKVGLLVRGPGIDAEETLTVRVKPVTATADETITNSIGMKLQLIPRGKFQMGSSRSERRQTEQQLRDEKVDPEDKDFKEWLDSEQPQHEVEITQPYYIGVYEVTQEEYAKVMKVNPSSFRKGGKNEKQVKGVVTTRFPVECVSWKEAVEFCQELSNSTEEKAKKRAYRLPTEAEWEHACRGGTTTVFHCGDKLTFAESNFDWSYPFGATDKRTPLGHPVEVDDSNYKPNGFGLYHMHGNVREWCSDWYDPHYYQTCVDKKILRDPQGPDKLQDRRALRGGSWYVYGEFCRSACRYGDAPDVRNNNLGFRVVCVRAP